MPTRPQGDIQPQTLPTGPLGRFAEWISAKVATIGWIPVVAMLASVFSVAFDLLYVVGRDALTIAAVVSAEATALLALGTFSLAYESRSLTGAMRAQLLREQAEHEEESQEGPRTPPAPPPGATLDRWATTDSQPDDSQSGQGGG